jgi:hypothetical protein
MAFKDAVVSSAITRAQPIALTGLAAMMGAFFILDDPIFNGLAISDFRYFCFNIADPRDHSIAVFHGVSASISIANSITVRSFL